MNKLIVTALLFILVGCNKEEAQKDCMCHEVHEEYKATFSNGMPTFKWTVVNETTPQQMSCDNEADYVSTGNDERMKVVCE